MGGFDDLIAEHRADQRAAPDRIEGAYYWVDYGVGFRVGQYDKREWAFCGEDSYVIDAASFKVVGPIETPSSKDNLR